MVDTELANDWQTMQGSAVQAVSLLKAASNECRLVILCYLLSGERSVSELNETVDISQSALSQHLARLRKDELVTVRKEAQTVYYRIINPNVERLIGLMYEIYCKP